MFIVDPGLYRIYFCFIFLASKNLAWQKSTGFAERDNLDGSETGEKMFGGILIPASLGLKEKPLPAWQYSYPHRHTHVSNTRDQRFLHLSLNKAVLFERKTKQSKNL